LANAIQSLVSEIYSAWQVLELLSSAAEPKELNAALNRLKLIPNQPYVAVYNIGSGEIVSIAEIARQAIEVSGRPDVEFTDLEQTINYFPKAIMADIRKVSETVDWLPRVSLREGLKQMWEPYSS
jgi:nucleoside-diphosphate-sugar epimerase